MAAKSENDNSASNINKRDQPAFINKTTLWIDNHISLVRTSRFRSIEDIPERFIHSHVRLQGRVVQVSDGGNLLVDHTPIVASRFSPAKPHSCCLPVKLTSVDALDTGVTWIQQNIQDHQVWFQMMAVTADELSCIVTLKQRWYKRAVCVNEHLIQQGLAIFHHEPSLTEDLLYTKLVARLNKAEAMAEKKGYGIWKRPSLRERAAEYPRTVATGLHTRLTSICKSWIFWFSSIFKRKRN